jgi:hypothetical protein
MGVGIRSVVGPTAEGCLGGSTKLEEEPQQLGRTATFSFPHALAGYAVAVALLLLSDMVLSICVKSATHPLC